VRTLRLTLLPITRRNALCYRQYHPRYKQSVIQYSQSNNMTTQNKILLGGVAVGVSLLFSATAHAQSSVTLYGVLDEGIAYVHNAITGTTSGSTLFKLSSGNTFGSRWGLKGTEDLGSGLSAIFQLESGYSLSTGASLQGGALFGRKAVVGLSSNQYGTVTLGRQYDPVVDLVQPLTQDAYFGGTFGTPGDLDNYDNTLRVNSSVKYASPIFSGFQVEALYGFGGVAGATGNGQTYSFGAAYSGGPLSLAAGYLYANGGTTAVNGVRTWTSTSGTLFNTVINSGFASAKSISSVRAAGQYLAGPFTLGAAYSFTQYAGDSLSTFTQSAKFNSGSAFVNYRASTPLLLGIGYNYTSLTGPASAHYNQVNLGADYALSKRTSLYALFGYQKSSGQTLSATGSLIQANASVGDFGVSSNTNSQAIAAAGIRAKF
jgi:predicted porin